MWALIKKNALVHVVLIAVTVFTLLGCLDAVVRSLEPDVSTAQATIVTGKWRSTTEVPCELW